MSRHRRFVTAFFMLCAGVLETACGNASNAVPVTPPAPGAAATVVRRQLTLEPARSSAAFVDSVGVNVHLGSYGTPYGDQPARIAALIAQLGVHHLRDATYPGQTNLCALERQFAASGVHFDDVVSPGETPDNLVAWYLCSTPAADAYENFNEFDLSGAPDWSTTLRSVQQQLVSAAQSAGGITIVAPALSTEAAYLALGAIPTGVTNMHDYFAARNPGNPGWGASDAFGTYGSLRYDAGIAESVAPSAPLWATETGYGDSTASAFGVPATTKMHYTLRTLLEHWNAGVARTYLYELVDEGNDQFASYGLTDRATAPKPAFTALAALLAHLSDSGTASGTLSYALVANGDVHHALVAKHDGSFVLALWVEASEWNPDTRTPIAVPGEAVAVEFANVPHRVAVTTFGSDGTAVTASVAPAATMQLGVDGGVTLVDLVP